MFEAGGVALVQDVAGIAANRTDGVIVAKALGEVAAEEDEAERNDEDEEQGEMFLERL